MSPIACLLLFCIGLMYLFTSPMVFAQAKPAELLLHYDGKINEQGKVLDQSGNGHHAEVNGVKFRATAVGEQAMVFDGKQAHLKVPAELNLEGAFSISVWLRFDGIGNPYQRILGNRVLWRSPEGFEMELSPHTSSVNISGANTNGETQGMMSVNFIDGMKTPVATRVMEQEIDQRWVHVVGTLDDKGVIRFYVNGVESLSKEGVAKAVATQIPLYIGAAPVKTDEGGLDIRDLFKGEMGDLRVYRGALTPKEIKALSQTFDGSEAFIKEQEAFAEAFKQQLARFQGDPDQVSQEEIQAAQIIKDRFEAMLLADPTMDAQKVATVLADQKADGSWPQFDYKSQQVTLWPSGSHAGLLLQLSRVYRDKDHDYYKKPELVDAIRRGIKFYTDSKLYSKNWWWNEIGVPRISTMLLYMIGDALNEDDLQRLDQMISDPLRMGQRTAFTGQNLIWRARIVMLQAAWKKDVLRLRRAMREMNDEIIVTEAEGLQIDGSFWQHDEQLYTHGYGASFALEVAELIKLTNGTAFALPAEKVALMDLLILDGQQWMLRRGFRDPMAMGRNIARPGATGVVYGQRNYPYIAGIMAEVEGPRQQEYLAYQKRLLGQGKELVGQRVFWRSDFTTHHRPEFYIGVKSTSNRMYQNEAGNWENLMGRFLGDGITTIVTHGKEYPDIYPVWDWRYLPGATSVGNPLIKGRGIMLKGSHPFVGAVTDGAVGIHVMVRDDAKMKAKKAWFLLDEGMVCLGVGIEGKGKKQPWTTLNQVFLKGEVKALLGDGVHTLGPGVYETTAQAIEHDGILYWMPGENDYRLSMVSQEGHWRKINQAYTTDPVSAEVFKLYLNHDEHPEGNQYHYGVFPGMKIEDAKGEQPVPYELIANTGKMQAISQNKKGLLYVVFYEAGQLEWKGKTLKVSEPCLVLIKSGVQDEIYLSDPSQQLMQIELEWDGEKNVLELPQSSLAGSTVQLK